MESEFAAHISEDNRVQSVKAHLNETAGLAGEFACRFDNGNAAYLCGLLHDIGKYSEKFQRRIKGLSNQRVDHSTPGAREVSNRIEGVGRLLAYCIAGHHTGLPDGGSAVDTEDDPTLYGRLKRKLESYIHFEEEIKIVQPEIKLLPMEGKGFTLSFYIRMLFSCLVDADFLNTEYFMKNEKRVNKYDQTDEIIHRLDEKLKQFENPFSDINKRRTEILYDCVQKSECNRGLYTLTVPTGGGKTLSSFAFALKHARYHSMGRIIYVIPYNSIIEQNAEVFKTAIGEQNVLEHHSGISYDTDDDEYKAWRLAAENWDMPVIVTTSVQFFESLFANKTSKCRKLHNIANSVIIFDEAQLLPIKYLKPCVRAISELVYNYKCTALLCSATQPALERLFPKELNCQELIEVSREAFEYFRRTNLVFIGQLEDTVLAERLGAEKQVMCIVSTRKQAQNLYSLLKGDGTYHLSTFMYPQHRKEVLDEIREKLYNGETCRVVSTSLIEAGVDVDFPVVFRAEAGLDSLIQAAGRCNREGKRPLSPVYIFKPEQKYSVSLPPMLKRPVSIMNSVAGRFDDIASPEAVKAYFGELYHIEGEGLDTKNVVNRFEEGYETDMSFPFASIAKEFKLIDENTRAIIIPRTEKAQVL
ncbi:MAG: CRISPR-associated helicase Cas3', partial [Eubacteriales bacterium]|nr:CRISPR-associated helicase Cas3' [Eubacteriales bacterium]